MKLSAHSETEYKGTVLMNPGGPGASGVVYLASIGSLLTSIIGNNTISSASILVVHFLCML